MQVVTKIDNFLNFTVCGACSCCLGLVVRVVAALVLVVHLVTAMFFWCL